jgi:AcrR family transcriptional regulator
MPKISPAQRETRRQQILDAALRCFSRDGFHATTTADIVRESGVSQGTLYLYFATKEDIVLALSDDRHARQALLNGLAMSEQDPVKGLAAFIELHGVGLLEPGRVDGRRVGIQGWAEALRDQRIHDSVVGGMVSVREAIVRLVERGQRTGQIRADIEPESVARTLIALHNGFLLQIAWGEAIDFAAVGHTVRGMVGGILTPDGLASWPAD